LSVRIIPRLDVKGPNLVKGVHMEGLRVLGLPESYALRYYQDGADEIIYIDTVASLYGRNNLSEIVSRAAENIYIPLTVGGGIRTVDNISQLLRAGADKVAINTWAIANPRLISEGARTFGSQCIVLYVEAIKRGPGKYECLTDNAREQSGIDVFEWVNRAVGLGAGEILLTSVDREGTGKGFDIELTSQVADMVDVPVISCGGAGTREHVRDVITQGHADAVCAASLFHYAVIEEMAGLAAGYPGGFAGGFTEGNTEFLKRELPIPTLGRRHITPTTLYALKEFLADEGISVRRAKHNPEVQPIAD
jgi:cyclase